MAKPMHLERQEAYEWPVAVYLFLGGLGGGLITLAFVLHFFAAAANMVGLAVLSGLVCFAFAGAFLVFFDLEQPLNAVYSLNNAKTSGISWDVLLIIANFLFGILFVLPEYGNIQALSALAQSLAPYQVIFGAIAALAGFLFPIISGGLLAAPASIPLWHTPALPVLFLVTSFGLALAYLGSIFALNGSVYIVFIGGILTFSLLAFAISLSYLEHTHHGVVEAKEGARRMLHTPRFILLYFLAGLAFPLVLSAYLLFTGATLAWAMPAMAVALLAGGFSLRNCIILNGIQTYPWPY